MLMYYMTSTLCQEKILPVTRRLEQVAAGFLRQNQSDKGLPMSKRSAGDRARTGFSTLRRTVLMPVQHRLNQITQLLGGELISFEIGKKLSLAINDHGM